jgi:cell division transport system ATP-binding protein
MDNKNTLVEYSGVAIERGGTKILDGVSFSVKAGEMVTIEGPIGTGKSSLFKTLYADLPVAGGKASVLGFDLKGLPDRKVSKLRRRMGIIFQDYQLFDNKTVSGNLQFVIDSLEYKTPCDNEEYIAQVLERVGIPGKSGTFPHMLSGGEKQSVAIARAIVCKPELIIADEPTGNLDEASALHIAELLYSIAKEGAGVIVATHDENIFDQFPHRTLRIQDGTIVEQQ